MKAVAPGMAMKRPAAKADLAEQGPKQKACKAASADEELCMEGTEGKGRSKSWEGTDEDLAEKLRRVRVRVSVCVLLKWVEVSL